MEDTRDSLFGRTSPAHSAATEDATSSPSCKRSRLFANPPFQYLNLREAENPMDLLGCAPGALWETVGASLGGSWTRNTSEYPNVVKESTLSQILVANAPKKYYLSGTACAGVLRRAEKRGKEIPKMLKDALMEVMKSNA